MTFPAFWFEPVAKRLDEVPCFAAVLVGAAVALEVFEVAGLLLELS